MNGRLKGIGLMNGWMNAWLDGWMDRRVNECMKNGWKVLMNEFRNGI
jgi:hypothetical protein